jgi:hypothetical protein
MVSTWAVGLIQRQCTPAEFRSQEEFLVQCWT